MKALRVSVRFLLPAVLCLLFTGLALAQEELAANPNPGIAPIDSKPGGKSYSQWAAKWWKWVLETPASVNPNIHLEPQFCSENQPEDIWFLAGSFTGGPITRKCTVPRGRPLLVPLINRFYGAFLNDPPDQRTEEFVRSQVTCVQDAKFSLLKIDGVSVKKPKSYLEKSSIFKVVLPKDNILGVTKKQVPKFTLYPSVDQGYYLYVYPLKPGKHTIKARASSEACRSSIDITYRITVE